MFDAINKKSFGLGWTGVNKVRKLIVYILDDIYFFQLPMVIWYTVFDVNFSDPAKFW